MTENKFIEELKLLGIHINEIQLKQLNQYYQLLIVWNEKINLTSITEKDQVYLKHFYDSLTIIKVIDLNNEQSLCDIGSGAGFPGIVLKIMFPHLKITLVDSLNKRIIFLNDVIEKIGLKDITTIHSRAEDYAIKHKEEYDVVTARAVAPLHILLEYCVPIIKVNKYFIAMKGNISQEIIDAKTALKALDSEVVKQEEFLLPIEGSNRAILKIVKLKKTNPIYPRKFSEIKKKSL